MLEAQTNCTFLSLVSLVNYGNWCGPGSNGRDPVDDVDTCCQVLTPIHPILAFLNELFERDMTCATTQLTSLDYAMGYIQPWSPTNLSPLPMGLLPATIATERIS